MTLYIRSVTVFKLQILQFTPVLIIYSGGEKKPHAFLMYFIVLRISVSPCAVYFSAVTSIYSHAARALSVQLRTGGFSKAPSLATHPQLFVSF